MGGLFWLRVRVALEEEHGHEHVTCTIKDNFFMKGLVETRLLV